MNANCTMHLLVILVNGDSMCCISIYYSKYNDWLNHGESFQQMRHYSCYDASDIKTVYFENNLYMFQIHAREIQYYIEFSNHIKSNMLDNRKYRLDGFHNDLGSMETDFEIRFFGCTCEWVNSIPFSKNEFKVRMQEIV